MTTRLLCDVPLCSFTGASLSDLESHIRAVHTLASERSTHDLLTSVCQLLVEVLTELRHLRAAQGATAEHASSVKITTSTRGQDICVHAYADSPVIEAEAEAIQSYLRIRAALEDRLMDGFKKTTGSNAA